MKKEYIENRIKEIKESIKTSENNKELAENHITEGYAILKTFQDMLKNA